MSAERRLAKLEASLPPREAVLHWLGDVPGHGSLEAYVASVVDERGASPLVALTERVAAAARATHAREPRPIVREAERRATMDTVFLVMLVLELDHTAIETIRVGSPRRAALTWELRARSAEVGADRRAWAAWRADVRDLATDVARTEAVRRSLEGRYLDGRQVLFPVTQAAWAELHDGVAELVSTIPSLPRRRRKRPSVDAIGMAAERAAPDEARVLVDRVRARTLDLLGDHGGAAAIVEGALRGPP